MIALEMISTLSVQVVQMIVVPSVMQLLVVVQQYSLKGAITATLVT